MQHSHRDPIISLVCMCVCAAEHENDKTARCSQLTMPEMKSQLMTAHKMYNYFKRMHYKNATMHGDTLGKTYFLYCNWKSVKNATAHCVNSTSKTGIFNQQIGADS